ncbi:MAG: hypothetical protein HFG68_11120 [Hungatella sp.]|nr:hypothetical protein [Hungatella sp.]
MDYNNTYEQEIDLKELMFAVLHKWRIILAFAVGLALVLGGYKAVTSYMEQNDEETAQEAQEEYEKELLEYNKSIERCEREIDNLTKDIANQEEYLEKSILTNMSPYDVWEAKVELFIKTDYEIMPDMVYQNLDFTGTVLQSYQSALTSTEFMEKVASKAGTDTRYLRELVSINIGRVDNKVNNILTIQVRHESEEKAKAILDDLLAGVNQFKGQIRSSIGNHTITEVSRSLGALVDLSLVDQQKNQTERLIQLNDSLQEKQTELDELEEPEPVVTAASAVLKGGIKYALIGGVLGAFIVIFFVCVIFVMSDKLYSAKELKYRFRVKILGTLPVTGSKKTGKIDAWLDQMEGRAVNKDESHEYSLIAANICNYTEEAKSLLVVGSAKEENISRVASELTDRLSDMKVVFGGNLLNDEEGLKKLPECDGIVLVERCGESLYSAIELEIEKAHDLQKKVVGCVVFE